MMIYQNLEKYLMKLRRTFIKHYSKLCRIINKISPNIRITFIKYSMEACQKIN